MTMAPFIDSGLGVHPVLNLTTLFGSFPDYALDVWNISSPSDVIGWEQLREEHNFSGPGSIPCDLFVWGVGDSPDRRLTRIGGVPWLPKKNPWPKIGDVVTTFLCQFDFRDSTDLLGQRVADELPGDILLVFVADEEAMLGGNADEMRFIWVSADESDIISAEDVPLPSNNFDFVTAWGVRYRTMDMPGKWDEAYAIPDDAAGGRCWSLPVLWGTKIGGVPYNSQENYDEVPPNYLCQLTSVQPSSDRWPWVNREAPLASIHADECNLMIGDMGEITFFLTEDGSIAVNSACG